VGKANTKRREFLRYWERHHEKLAASSGTESSDHDPEQRPSRLRYTALDQPRGALRDAEVSTEVASSMTPSRLASTKATTYVADLLEKLDLESSIARSETSYVASVANESSYNGRQIPDPPKESAHGMPFECPYCYTIQVIRHAKHWRKHVLTDLQPYLCTFEYCSSQMFESRHSWFQHELEMHRKLWRYNFCPIGIFTSTTKLRRHLQVQHAEYTRQQMSSLITLCEQSPENIAASACPFCDWESQLRVPVDEKSNPIACEPASRSASIVVSPEELQNHVSHHYEHLAVFALPVLLKETSGASSNQAAQDLESAGGSKVAKSWDSFPSEVSFTEGPIATLYEAVQDGDIERVKNTIEGGADMNALGTLGNIFEVAITLKDPHKRHTIMKLLLDSGADSKADGGRRVGGRNVFPTAVIDNDRESIRSLRDAGADVTTTNNSGQSPLRIARIQSHEEIENSLENHFNDRRSRALGDIAEDPSLSE